MSGGFEALGLMPELLLSVAELGWSLPTDVQDESIPLILGGGDVMVASETGTGKTAAFCLPILQCVHERLREVELKESGGQAEGPYDVKVSSFQKDAALSVSENGMSCSSSEPQKWIGARASHGVRSGKYYFEVSITGTGVCRVGWSTTSAHLELGKDPYGYGFGGTGMKSNDNKFEAYGEKFGDSDTIGCYLDWDERTISYSKNGTHLGVAFKISDSVSGSALFPAFVVQNMSLTINFSGNIPFRSFVQVTLVEGYTTLSLAAQEDIVCESSKEAFAVRGKRLPLAIIIEPTKELAEQVTMTNRCAM
jgi:ATP-dependent RNA helicase DDX1